MRQILALITILLASHNGRKNKQPIWKEGTEHICLGAAGFSALVLSVFRSHVYGVA